MRRLAASWCWRVPMQIPADGSAALFKAESAELVERFAAGDPYVRAGLVKRWHVRKWTTVVGELASNPVRPAAA